VFFVGVGDPPPLSWMAAGLKRIPYPDAALSHRCATHVRGLLDWDESVHITTTNRNTHDFAGIELHRVRAPFPVLSGYGLRITSIEQTVLDLATTEREKTVQRVLNEALYKRIVNTDRLAEMARGRRGARAVRNLIASSAPTQSYLEDRFYRLIREAELPPPLAQQFVGPYRVDFLWPDRRYVVETDGWAGHGLGFQRLNDARRDAYLSGLGFRTGRVPGHRFEHHPYAVIAELAVAVAS
jgi:very-short-patch-repair endonuclease